MKIKQLPFLLFFISTGYAVADNILTTRPTAVFTVDYDKAVYQKIYYDYRELVTTAINNNDQTNLNRISEEYAKKIGINILLVTISKQDSSGKWPVLFHKAAALNFKLPNIHHGGSGKVHITKVKDFLLYESNMLRDGSYTDDIYITMVIGNQTMDSKDLLTNVGAGNLAPLDARP